MNKRSWLILAVLPALLACPPETPPPPEVPVPATVKSFTASPTEVEANAPTTLTWEIENATSLTLRTLSGKQIPVPEGSLRQGTVQVEVAESTVFVLTAVGEGGSDSAAASVVVAKDTSSAMFTAIPATVVAGEAVTLVWNIPGAAQVNIKDGVGRAVISSDRSSGSVEVTPSSSTTFQLTAGEISRTVEVSVQLKIHAFVATPPAVAPGGQVTLQWKVGAADKVTIEADGRGEIYSEVDPTKVIDGSFSENVPEALPTSFGLVRYTLKAHLGGSVSSQSLEVFVGTEPRIVQFNLPLFVRQGEGATLSWRTAFANHVEVLEDGKRVFTAPSQDRVDQGSYFFSAISGPRQVEFRARNGTGAVVSQKATVSPVEAPVVNAPFTASPTVVSAGGDPVTLTWNVTNARRAKVSIRNGYTVTELTGSDAENGSITVYPNKLTEYVLEVDNTVGDVLPQATATVDVTTPAQIVFDPPRAPVGATVSAVSHNVPMGGDVTFFPTWRATSTAFEDISSTGTGVDYDPDFDTTAKLIDLGRNFQTMLFGRSVGGDKISVANNGWFFFNPSTVSGPDGPGASAPELPSTALEPFAIAPFWADLNSGSFGEIYWKLEGSGPSERLIVQWDRFRIDSQSSSEVTFQAQVYASGRVVFAYKTMTGIPSSQRWSVGVVNGDESDAPIVTQRPAAGEAFEMLTIPVSLPAPVKVPSRAFTARVSIGNGHWIDVDVNDLFIPRTDFFITEVNYNPATGEGEWFEVTNATASPVDLTGWVIDFGNGSTHTITGPLAIPAGGMLLFGQDADATDASANGPAVDYVYGTSFTMPNASGSVALTYYGGVQTRASWTSAGTQGSSLMFDATNPRVRFASPTGVSSCAGSTTYGSGVQRGTPGSASRCFPWTLAPAAPNGFTSIAATGTAIIRSTSNNDQDYGTASVNFVSAGGRAVKIGNSLWGDTTNVLTVNANGWISMGASSDTSTYAGAVPTTSTPNSVLAVFWDDLAGNAGTPAAPSGVYWQQFDPDATPNTGDEYTIVSWENWKAYHSNGSLNFQVKFLEGTGDVEFHYGTMQSTDSKYANGLEAAAWLESATGHLALTIGALEPWVQENSGWKFTYAP